MAATINLSRNKRAEACFFHNLGNNRYRGLAVPIRGSSFNNTSNGGVAALNLNNPRSNSNNNVAFRSASPLLPESHVHK